MDPQARRALVNLLLRISGIDHRATRTCLLAGLDADLRTAIDRSDIARVDVSVIVETVQDWNDPALGRLLDNAADLAGSGALGRDLATWRAQYWPLGGSAPGSAAGLLAPPPPPEPWA